LINAHALKLEFRVFSVGETFRQTHLTTVMKTSTTVSIDSSGERCQEPLPTRDDADLLDERTLVLHAGSGALTCGTAQHSGCGF